MKPRQLSRTMLAATGFALAVLLITAFALPTCRRGAAPGDVAIVVDTVAPDSTKTTAKARRDSTSTRKKKKAKAKKPHTPPSSRNYMDEGTKE